jgi:hypothetical protein
VRLTNVALGKKKLHVLVLDLCVESLALETGIRVKLIPDADLDGLH